MKTLVRIVFVLCLLAALLPARSAAAEDILAPDPACYYYGELLGATAISAVVDGSIVCIMIPKYWNGDAVIFAHGYVSPLLPVAIPWDQMVLDESNNLPGMVTSLGYAFATTSYSKNGLAMKQGVQDVLNLVDFMKGFANSLGAQIGRIYLTGASEGGLVTALAMEQAPEVFAAGFSTCGPVGSFQDQVQYLGDFRVAFDRKFVNNLLVQYGATPIYIPPVIWQNWGLLSAGLGQSILANPDLAFQLLMEQQVPYDPADPGTVLNSISSLLWYSVFATNDARLTLVPGLTMDDLLPPSLLGNPYSNPSYRIGYPKGIKADKNATKEIQRYYTTSADLERPLVLMHTIDDPVVPFSQSTTYLKKAFQAGTLHQVSYIPIDRYGHCAFEPSEILFGFYVMVLRATFNPFSTEQIQAALPSAVDQVQFEVLKEKHKNK
jgi:fermentation-respiration switch protein FrsA (DUF1100 family)